MGQKTESQVSRPIIWIIGNTVLMDGVAACLEERQITNLVHWDVLNADLDANLQASKPDLIIFELETPSTNMLLDLLKEQPGIQLLGLNQNCSQVIVLNSFQRTTRTMTDLYQVVQEVAGAGD